MVYVSYSSKERELITPAARISEIELIGIKKFQVCYLTDLDPKLSGGDALSGKAIKALFLLPLIVIDRRSNGGLLARETLPA